MYSCGSAARTCSTRLRSASAWRCCLASSHSAGGGSRMKSRRCRWDACQQAAGGKQRGQSVSDYTLWWFNWPLSQGVLTHVVAALPLGRLAAGRQRALTMGTGLHPSVRGSIANPKRQLLLLLEVKARAGVPGHLHQCLRASP